METQVRAAFRITAASTGGALAVLVCLLFVGRAAASEDCPVPLDISTILRLYDAQDVAELERLHRSLTYSDAVVELVFAARRAVLSPGEDSDAYLLKAIPRNAIELWSAYALTSPALNSRRDGLGQLFYDYLQTVRRVLQESEGSDEAMRKYVLLKAFADGEVAEFLADENVRLAEAAPKQFCRVVRALNVEDQKRILHNGIRCR